MSSVKTVQKTKSMMVAQNQVSLGGQLLLGLGVIEAINESILLPDIEWKIKFTSSLGHLIVHNHYCSWG